MGTFATKTSIIIFCAEGILVWAIPPLLPHSPDHFLDNNPTHLPPLFRIPFPGDIVYNDVLGSKTICSWYFGFRESIYFDVLRQGSDAKLDRFELIVKHDLSDTSLRIINTFELTPHNIEHLSFPSSYRICEDTVFSFWCISQKCGVHTGLTSTHFPDDFVVRHWITRHSHSLCPVSGRFVYFAYGDGDDSRVVVIDLI